MSQNRHVLVHLNRHGDKQETLLHMLKKCRRTAVRAPSLYTFAQGGCREDNADALSSHELLLPGHLFCMYLKEKLDETLQKVKDHFKKDARLDLPKTAAAISDAKYIARVFDSYCSNARPPPLTCDQGTLEQILVALGVTASGAGAGDGSLMLPHYYLPVMLDGRVIGGGTSETTDSSCTVSMHHRHGLYCNQHYYVSLALQLLLQLEPLLTLP
eukprot:12104-Heterococcus_DN1.PRE.9